MLDDRWAFRDLEGSNDTGRVLCEGYLVPGEVVRIHIAERVFTGDRIDPLKLRPIGRLSGSSYARLGELISIKRPTRQDLIDLGLQPGSEF